MSEQLMWQGPDRRDIRQSKGDFFLELLFGFVKGTDGRAIFVDNLRELVLGRGDFYGQ